MNPEKSIKLLSNTLESIKKYYPDLDSISIIPDGKVSDFTPICKTYKSTNNTYSSLINCGMNHSKFDWNIIVFAGSWVRPSLENIKKYYIKSEKSVLFSVPSGKIERRDNKLFDKASFAQGSANGLFIHQSVFKELGELPNSPKLMMPETLPVNDFELIKLEWSYSGIKKGISFIPLFGVAIC